MSNYELNKLNKLILEVNEDLQSCKDDLIADKEPDSRDKLIGDNKSYTEDVMNRLEILQSQHAFLSMPDAVRLNHLLKICSRILRNVEV